MLGKRELRDLVQPLNAQHMENEKRHRRKHSKATQSARESRLKAINEKAEYVACTLHRPSLCPLFMVTDDLHV